MQEELKKRHIKRLPEGTCTIEMGFVLADLTTNFEQWRTTAPASASVSWAAG